MIKCEKSPKNRNLPKITQKIKGIVPTQQLDGIVLIFLQGGILAIPFNSPDLQKWHWNDILFC